MISFAITSLLLVFMINEERYAPAEPIIADTVRSFTIEGGSESEILTI